MLDLSCLTCHALTCHALTCNALTRNALTRNALTRHALTRHARTCHARTCHALSSDAPTYRLLCPYSPRPAARTHSRATSQLLPAEEEGSTSRKLDPPQPTGTRSKGQCFIRTTLIVSL